jgi:hypothetical protein
MIFSFSEDDPSEVKIVLPNTDIFCFFAATHAVGVPSSEWWKAVAASLRIKKDVLILEKNITLFTSHPSARWLISESFLWLSPRSLSVFLEASHQNSNTYHLLKSKLRCFK